MFHILKQIEKRGYIDQNDSCMSDDACNKQQEAIRSICLYIKNIQCNIAEKLSCAHVDAKRCMEEACALMFAAGDSDQWHEDCEDHELCLEIVKLFDVQMSSLLAMKNLDIDTKTREALRVRMQSLQKRWSHLS